MTTTTTAGGDPAATAAPEPLTARECAAYAADTLKAAAKLGDPGLCDALAKVADGWRSLGETVARNPTMGPPAREDDDR